MILQLHPGNILHLVDGILFQFRKMYQKKSEKI
jgi:hypothetical protein